MKYYDTAEQKKRAVPSRKAIHTEFLRTGKINRRKEDWLPEERRYLTHEEVAERTGKKLEAAGSVTHQRINSFHNAIRFPKMLFHRTLADSPHLGYCHVTAARSSFSSFDDVAWSFYIANFFSEIGTSDAFFERINVGFSRMYFAVAMEQAADGGKMAINRKVRGNGLLFRTHDPKLALKNVLLLGAGHDELRKIVRAL
ncbi:MAG: hypothetical protein Q7U22_06295 [Pararhizobium sp.]|nr:DUF6656 family protein [Pararhizobium sp.]MDO9415711.1 hypothetical protein [Pararhizobium sp.]